MSDLNAVLNEREATHGNFAVQGAFAQELKNLLCDTPNWESLPAHQREALQMIATKISRVLHGDASHEDSWRDIAGYAQLAVEPVLS